MLHQAASDSPETAASALLRPDLDAPAPQFAALSEYLRRFVRPGAGLASSHADTAVRELAKSHDRDVAALSLATLDLAGSTDAATRDFLTSALKADVSGKLRTRWKAVLEYMGLQYQSAGDMPAAIRTLQKAEGLAPGDTATLEKLALALAQRGDTAGAAKAMRSAISANPDQMRTLVLPGVLAEQSGDMRGALTAYEHAAEVNPWNVSVLSRLGTVYLALGNSAEARRVFERVVELDRSSIEAQLTLTEILEAQGDRAGAMKRIEEALAFDPASQQARAMRDALVRGEKAGSSRPK